MSESLNVLLGTLIERWRKLATTDGLGETLRDDRVIARMLRACADELEAALATLPQQPLKEFNLANGTPCYLKIDVEGLLYRTALPPAPPQPDELKLQQEFTAQAERLYLAEKAKNAELRKAIKALLEDLDDNWGDGVKDGQYECVLMEENIDRALQAIRTETP